MNATDVPAPVLTQALTKRFGEQTAVSEMSLRVPPHAIVGLIGPSGCGKTTAVRLMTGAYEPTSGHALLFGKDPTQLSSLERRRVGYLPQQPILFDSLTLWENLNYSASLYGMRLRRRKRLRDVLDLTELTGHERKRVDQVSGGMKRRLALAGDLGPRPGGAVPRRTDGRDRPDPAAQVLGPLPGAARRRTQLPRHDPVRRRGRLLRSRRRACPTAG